MDVAGVNATALTETAAALMADGHGLLAMDESTGTCNRRFAAAGIPQTVEARRAWRELLVCTPGLARFISGAILFDETIHQHTTEGVAFVTVLRDAGIIPGIKVDLGAEPLAGHAGERVTEGLDGLRARLAAYVAAGARFAKWRAVIAIGAGLPTRACIAVNAQALARYAALCQEAMLVPIVEPEVLMDGDHSLQRCRDVTHETLLRTFDELDRQGVLLEGMILKPNMVVPGLACPIQVDDFAVADATVTCLLRSVPGAVAGIAFLSGGQSGELASGRLAAMHRQPVSHASRRPWPLSFSFGRALQEPALAIWAGDEAHRVKAQAALLHRAACNGAAVRGAYDVAMEAA